MLNRNSRNFLKFLLNNDPDYADRVYTYTFIEGNYPVQIELVFATVRYLNAIGYLDIAETTGSHTHFGVILTEKALHRHQFQWENIKRILFESVFLPIVVSFVTTLITLYLTQMLQMQLPS